MNDKTVNNTGTDYEVIIAGVSTYAQAAKEVTTVQSYKQGTTFIGKRVNFDKPGSKQISPNNPTFSE